MPASAMQGILTMDERTHSGSADIEARVPEFADLNPGVHTGANGNGSMDHLLDVSCLVTVELGKIRLPLGDVMKWTPGSLLELDRLIAEPVDVLVQGVLLARGEIVVVNDHFAVRIKEIVEGRSKK